MNKPHKRLGDLLIEAELVTNEQLETALREKKANQKIGETLLQLGFISEQRLIEVLEFQLGIPYVSLFKYPIDTKLLNIVPKETAERNKLIPLKKENNKLFVAMADPMDFYAIDDLRLSTGFQIEVVIATKEDIQKSINKYYSLVDNMDDLLGMDLKSKDKEEDTVTDENSPVVKLVNQMILVGYQQRASDIHIDPGEAEVVVRYRVDGILRTEQKFPKNMLSMIVARIKIMSNLNITEFRVPQDGRIKIIMDGNAVDLRISTLPTVYGEKVVMRILDLGSSAIDLKRMNFHPTNYERFVQMIDKPTGIVLITGPTGSGKSSTLYSALSQLNTPDVNIITVEDPVEYRLQGVNQVQVNANTGMTFAKGLRAILRQDPNIVMVGEIRDTETAEISVRASLTGHLVLSTIHTNDAISTITRLIDMGIEPFLVAASLSGVVAQRLVRRICQECKTIHMPTNREQEIFKNRGLQVDTIARGKGCGACNMTGYKGRIAIHEILVIDDEIRRMIMNNRSIEEIRQIAVNKGTIFLLDDGLMKVKEGYTTTEEVLRVAISE
ncbi:type IV pilus assembly protein PilB [Paenibacillus uliginis N3/975]|uniref:Type IV pilus assembly protein PilB n=1 Tax=Paenibacillus uliginis N3/975 TaxID=1313296 RepID=A0A1X7HEA2_9BACL|nr:ATPase, T2SS/T4P/T4SS family [Paenibacillus uliginis]SMF84841.1 type IV pilus assembly protein PilB [Paenibacillus uliginis N3/975]